jgi:D-threonate/D-erythronate kinase
LKHYKTHNLTATITGIRMISETRSKRPRIKRVNYSWLNLEGYKNNPRRNNLTQNRKDEMLPMRTNLAILADDISGAGDTGMPFAAAGFRTRILCGNWTAADTQGADLLVVDTASRALAGGDAATAVCRSASALTRAGVLPFFKKIDSTLRGQVGAEIDALMDTVGFSCAVLCPAYPANRRSVSGGTLLVNGQPVALGVAGKDPLTPISESHIPTLLATQSRRPLLTCAINELYSGKLVKKIEQAKGLGAVLICDALSSADLRLIAEGSLANRKGILLVGAAGLAQPVAEILSSEMDIPARQPGEAWGNGNPVITVVGSLHPVSREQVQQLEDGGAGLVTLTPADVFGDNPARRCEALAGECLAVLKSGKIPILVSAGRASEGSGEAVFDEPGAAHGLDPAGTGATVASALAKAVSQFFRHVPGAAVLASGGDVARAILAEFDCCSLDITGEAAPGMPICSIRGGKHPRARMVTKAGGFGQPDALATAVAVLAGKK